MIKTILKINKCKKAKWLSEGALQIPEKIREAKGKVEKTNRSFRYDLNQILQDYTVEVTNIFKGLDLIHRVAKNYGQRFMALYRRH